MNCNKAIWAVASCMATRSGAKFTYVLRAQSFAGLVVVQVRKQDLFCEVNGLPNACFAAFTFEGIALYIFIISISNAIC